LAWFVALVIGTAAANIDRFDIIFASNYVSINKPKGWWKNLIYLGPWDEGCS